MLSDTTLFVFQTSHLQLFLSFTSLHCYNKVIKLYYNLTIEVGLMRLEWTDGGGILVVLIELEHILSITTWCVVYQSTDESRLRDTSACVPSLRYK